MNLEDQVTSLELSKKLKELEIKQESLFLWGFKDNEKPFICNIKPKLFYDYCSAFTASELFEILPDESYLYKDLSNEYYNCGIDYHEIWGEYYIDKNPCNALAKMLIHLVENKVIAI